MGRSNRASFPLDFMLRLMRDPNTPDLIRIDMAKAAAPYLHARLQAVTHSSEADNPIMTVTKIERVIVDSARLAEHFGD